MAGFALSPLNSLTCEHLMVDNPRSPDQPKNNADDAVEQAISKAQDSLQSIADQPQGEIISEVPASPKPKPVEKAAKQPTTIFQCVSGSAIAGLFGYGAYSLTTKIATNFALHPFISDNFIAVRISAAVRTLVVGMFTLATAVFGFAAIGLFALGLQTAFNKLKPEPPASL